MTIGGRALSLPTFNPTVTVDATSTIDSGSGTDDWVARASIKRRSSDNALVMAYYMGEAHATNVGAIRMREKPAGGAWTARDTAIGGGAIGGLPLNPPLLSGSDAGEPWLYVAPNGDHVLHTWRIDYSVQMGGTHQWRRVGGTGALIYEGLVHFAGIADSSIVFATDDDFVLDRVTYAAARVFTGGADGTPAREVLIRNVSPSLAIGSWEAISTICDDDEGTGGAQEVGLEYLGHGRILAMVRDNDHTASYQRIAENLGATDADWGTLTNVTSTVGIAGRQRIQTRAKLLGLPGWWEDDILLMNGFVHQTSGSSMPRRNAVWAALKLNGGTSLLWDGPHYVDVSTEDAGYGDLYYENGLYKFVSYQGTQLIASLKQYDLDIAIAA